jgi:SAM domain (Sterile alpha motif)
VTQGQSALACAQRFAESRIDFSVLRDLTDQDPKELGVVLSDRRKLLRAIAANKARAPFYW